MIKVTLLGDSIRQIGYGTVVPQMLGDEFTVFQPVENCQYSKFTYRGLYDWRNDMAGSDIVHWNNGLWDVGAHRPDPDPFSSPEEYVTNMVRIAKYLKQHHKVVIFATTTPTRPEHDAHDQARIVRYNELVVPELQKLGVIINDLHTLVAADVDRYIRSDDFIHLTEEGIRLCGEQVTRYIREAAKTL